MKLETIDKKAELLEEYYSSHNMDISSPLDLHIVKIMSRTKEAKELLDWWYKKYRVPRQKG